MAFGFDDIANAVTGVSNVIGKVIDKVFPDPMQAAQAKALLQSSEAQAELDDLKARLSVFLAEAQSADPWTSRARPSFMYVVYILILWGLPMSLIWAFFPETGANIGDGFKAWLHAIPDALWATFGSCFSVYAIGRTFEKVKGAA